MPMALPLLGAAASIGAGLEIGGLIGGLMIAGGAATAVGALGGNSDLVKFGGLLSLAGGVSNLASGLAQQTAQEVARQASQEAFRAGEIGAQNAASVAEAAQAAASASSPAASALAAEASGGASTALPQGLTLGQGPSAGELAGLGAEAPAQAAAGQTGVIAGNSSPLQQIVKPAVAYGSPEAEAASGGSWFDKAKNAAKGLGSFVKDNKELVKAGTDLVGGAMAAIGQTDAIKTKLQLEEDAAARRRAAYSSSVKGLTVQPLSPTTYTPKG